MYTDFFTENESMINLVCWSYMLLVIFILDTRKLIDPIKYTLEILATVAWVICLFNVFLNALIKGF